MLLKKDSSLRRGNLRPYQKLLYYYGFYSYIVISLFVPIIFCIPILAVILRVYPFVLNAATVWILLAIVIVARSISMFTRDWRNLPLMLNSSLGYTLMTWVYAKAFINVAISMIFKREIAFKVRLGTFFCKCYTKKVLIAVQLG